MNKIKKKYTCVNHELAGIPLVASGKILEIEQLSDEAVQELLKAEHQH